jgi:hypothetical protein
VPFITIFSGIDAAAGGQLTSAESYVSDRDESSSANSAVLSASARDGMLGSTRATRCSRRCSCQVVAYTTDNGVTRMLAVSQVTGGDLVALNSRGGKARDAQIWGNRCGYSYRKTLCAVVNVGPS